MVVVFIILLALSLWKSKITLKGSNDDYLSLDSTGSIKGICILLIFFSHSLNYITLKDNLFNNLYLVINSYIGQSAVAMFMFYSGYGIMHNIYNKRITYIKKIPANRVLKTLLHFIIAILLYLVLQAILGQTYSFGHILLSFIGLESVGNSSWYIFVILVLYMISFVSFVFCHRTQKQIYIGLAIQLVLSLLLMVILYAYKEQYWFDTLLCYSLGSAYFLFKDKIELFLKKNLNYYLTFIGVVAVLSLALIFNYNALAAIFKYILVVLLVVMITLKFKIKSGGGYCFSLGNTYFPFSYFIECR